MSGELRYHVSREGLLERFLQYVRVDTQSVVGVTSYPSSVSQRYFMERLAEEIREMGLTPRIDAHGYLVVALPGRGKLRNGSKIGFLAHVDTSPDASGKGVRPRVHRYEGEPIRLEASGEELSETLYPSLARYRGEDIVVTSGKTLLGADDKAGVAALMEALAIWSREGDTEARHPVRVAFTMDEEVGSGVDFFDVKGFDADFAYTVDGGEIGSFEYENFNAASAQVRLWGRVTHTGDAKGKMINALRLALEFDSFLPREKRPEKTSGYEGFFHLHNLRGDCGEAELDYLIREHDRDKFEWMKQELRRAGETLSDRYEGVRVEVRIVDSYYNMGEIVTPDSLAVRLGLKAIREAGIEPVVQPIRGGTDGARLSYMGLPCPNLFAGGANFHSVHEYIPVRSLVKACEVVLRIAASEE